MQLVNTNIQTHFYSLDVIRAVSALTIVAYHGFQLITHFYPGIYQWGFPAFFGMEYFFVMSGFLITGLLFRLKTDSPLTAKFILRKFWLRRWMRTFPAYFVVLLLLVCFHGLTTSDGKTVLPYFFFLQNTDVTAPVFFPESWSICVEEWFYILLPFIFLLSGNGNKRNFLIIVLLFIVTITAIRCIYSVFWNIDFETGIKKILWLRIEAPFDGVVAWLLLDLYPKISLARKRIMFASGIGLQFIALFIYKYDALEHFKSALLWPTLLTGFTLMIPVLIHIQPGTTLVSRILQKTADMSFSIYLTHLALIQFTILPLFQFDQSVNGTVKSVIAYLILTAVATLLLHYLIEKPFLRLRRRIFPL